MFGAGGRDEVDERRDQERRGPPGVARLEVAGRGGVSRSIASRTDREPELKGTKRRVAEERRLLVARGARDGRMFVLVPEQQAGRAVGLTLMHLELREHAHPIADALLTGDSPWSELPSVMAALADGRGGELCRTIDWTDAS